MTELIQPLSAAPELAAGADAAAQRDVPTFAELVHARQCWWQAVQSGADEAGPMARAYHEVRRQFEGQHGRLVHTFWCSQVESAVALTELPRRGWRRACVRFHGEFDRATGGCPQIAVDLHRCDDLAVRGQAVLTGVRQRICLQLVAASAAHLLGVADGVSGGQRADEAEAALARERETLDQTTAYYRHAANGQAQIAYFAGMVAVAAGVSLVAGLVLAVEWTGAVAALIAGAVGAVVSVVQRINDGDFELDYDVGRPYAFFLGGLRPLIGGAFALAISFAFRSGMLHLPLSDSDPATDRRMALVVVSFLAGFSERWAQDTLATAVSTKSAAAAAKSEERPPAAKA